MLIIAGGNHQNVSYMHRNVSTPSTSSAGLSNSRPILTPLRIQGHNVCNWISHYFTQFIYFSAFEWQFANWRGLRKGSQRDRSWRMKCFSPNLEDVHFSGLPIVAVFFSAKFALLSPLLPSSFQQPATLLLHADAKSPRRSAAVHRHCQVAPQSQKRGKRIFINSSFKKCPSA